MRRAFHQILFLLVSAAPLCAAPPEVDVPAEIRATGDYVTVSPKTTAKAITYVGLSNVEPFPSEFLKDPKAFVLPVRGLPAGRYTFEGVASLNDEHRRFRFVVVVGDAPPEPAPPPKPKPVPPEPDGAFGLTKASRDGAAKVTSPAKAAEAKALADANRSFASAVAAGGQPDPSLSAVNAKFVLDEWAKANAGAVGAAAADRWKPWADAVAKQFFATYNAGNLKTKADWVDALGQIADGLAP